MIYVVIVIIFLIIFIEADSVDHLSTVEGPSSYELSVEEIQDHHHRTSSERDGDAPNVEFRPASYHDSR